MDIFTDFEESCNNTSYDTIHQGTCLHDPTATSMIPRTESISSMSEEEEAATRGFASDSIADIASGRTESGLIQELMGNKREGGKGKSLLLAAASVIEAADAADGSEGETSDVEDAAAEGAAAEDADAKEAATEDAEDADAKEAATEDASAEEADAKEAKEAAAKKATTEDASAEDAAKEAVAEEAKDADAKEAADALISDDSDSEDGVVADIPTAEVFFVEPVDSVPVVRQLQNLMVQSDVPTALAHGELKHLLKSSKTHFSLNHEARNWIDQASKEPLLLFGDLSGARITIESGVSAPLTDLIEGWADLQLGVSMPVQDGFVYVLDRQYEASDVASMEEAIKKKGFRIGGRHRVRTIPLPVKVGDDFPASKWAGFNTDINEFILCSRVRQLSAPPTTKAKSTSLQAKCLKAERDAVRALIEGAASENDAEVTNCPGLVSRMVLSGAWGGFDHGAEMRFHLAMFAGITRWEGPRGVEFINPADHPTGRHGLAGKSPGIVANGLATHCIKNNYVLYRAGDNCCATGMLGVCGDHPVLCCADAALLGLRRGHVRRRRPAPPFARSGRCSLRLRTTSVSPSYLLSRRP